MPPIRKRHHVLVRLAHAGQIPLLLGLMVSGLAIYWASPIYRHGGRDPLATMGAWICYLRRSRYPHPDQYLYNLLSLGPYQLAAALRLHWLYAYLYMGVVLMDGAGLLWGGGWRELLPRLSDATGAARMVRYYLGRLLQRPSPPPSFATKYNPLQRLAYCSVTVAGLLAIVSGWALHKPQTLGWLAALWGGYEQARIWHFWLMWFFVAFTLPHVILTCSEGWDTLRSMVVGWSIRPAGPPVDIAHQTRRIFLTAVPLYAAGWAFGLWLLPDDTLERLLRHPLASSPQKTRLLNRVLAFDDDVAEALFSPTRSVPTYDKQTANPHPRVNYSGRIPAASYLSNWNLQLAGLADGQDKTLTMADLLPLGMVEQVTRLVCVEGWSVVVWWGGVRFRDLLAAYPPPASALYVKLESGVGVDSNGHPDPYYVALDMPTARHPQTLLATQQGGAALTVEHGAPLRLVAPMKLGLKNIKALTRITYCIDPPPDYWHERGYSSYDGL